MRRHTRACALARELLRAAAERFGVLQLVEALVVAVARQQRQPAGG